jgi:hypothetical protein
MLSLTAKPRIADRIFWAPAHFVMERKMMLTIKRLAEQVQRSMNCRCGHPERAHVAGGRCRVPDCPCEGFEPGDTLPASHAAAARALLARSAEWTIRNSPTFSIVRTPTSSWSRSTGWAGQPEAFKR